MKRVLMFVPILVSSIFCQAQIDDSIVIKKMSDDIMTNGKAYENLRYLCKKIGQRLTGSVNAQKAVNATVQMLKDAGADTVYLQQCMVPHWVRGAKESGYVEVGATKKQLHLCALGNSVGTSKNGISAEVIEINSFEQLDNLGVDVIKGKIVFFNFPMNATYINTFRAYGESGKSRGRGPAKAAKYGAIGVIVRSLASNLNDYPHTGVTIYNDSFPKIPAVAISTNDAEWLSVALKKQKNVKAFFKTNCIMLPDVVSYNVVGEIRGNELPQEIITVGGHLDSWDLAEGAHDDGAGIVQSIEVLRAIKQNSVKSKRTIRAVMFMNEESAGRGGEKYLELAKKNKEHHVFALESDEGGFTPRGFSFENIDDATLEKIQQWENLFYNYGVYALVRGGSGSDIEDLKQVGAVLSGLNVDTQRYFDIHHAVTDVFENVSRRELHLGAVNMAALIYLIDKYGL